MSGRTAVSLCNHTLLLLDWLASQFGEQLKIHHPSIQMVECVRVNLRALYVPQQVSAQSKQIVFCNVDHTE